MPEDHRAGKPRVSIVIPAYNHARFITEAIDSALAQTYGSIEVLVMDDGSTDDTAAVVRRFGSSVRYHPLEHQGVYSARNASLDRITGEYFLNLDADNSLDPLFVEKTVALMEQSGDPRLALVYTQRRYEGDESGVSAFPEYDVETLKERNYIDMCTLIRADILKEVRFDPAFNDGCGDYDLFLTLAGQGYTGKLLDEPLLLYRVHSDTITSRTKMNYRRRAIVRRLVKKHGDLYSRGDRKRALTRASQRIQLAIVKQRSHPMSWPQRLRALGYFVTAGAGPTAIAEQFIFTLSPGGYRRLRASRDEPGE